MYINNQVAHINTSIYGLYLRVRSIVTFFLCIPVNFYATYSPLKVTPAL